MVVFRVSLVWVHGLIVKVALLSITLHVKTYKGIEKNVSHSPTVKHISAHAQQQIRQDI